MTQVTELIQKLSISTTPKDILDQLDAAPIAEEGLTEEDLIRLFEQLTEPKAKLTHTQKNHVIRNYLYFTGTVPSSIIYAIVSRLGVNDVPNAPKRLVPNLQIALIQWIISIYPYIAQPDLIERLYGMLFNYLEFEYLRNPIAHLLVLATKRKHVIESRVNRIVNLYNKDPQSDSIIALAVLYQEFQPELMLNVFPRVTRRVFKTPTGEYVEQLKRLHTAHGALEHIVEFRNLDDFGKQLKKRKVGAVALNYTASLNLVHAQSIDSLQKLAERIDSLNIPDDLDAVFLDQTGVSLLGFALNVNEEDEQKLDAWIKSSLENITQLSAQKQRQVFAMLEKYVDLTGDIRGVIVEELLTNERILKLYPDLWTYVWIFFSKLGPQNVEELKILCSLYNALFDTAEVPWCCGYLDGLSLVLKNCYNSHPDSTTVKLLSSLFKDALRVIPKKLVTTRNDRQLIESVLTLIDFLHHVPESLLEVDDVVLPPPLMYALLFMDDPAVFSLACGHLNSSKSIIKQGDNTPLTLEYTNLHNTYVVDVCNMTWRNKAFDIPKGQATAFGLTHAFTNSFASTVPIFDRNSNFKSLFNIHHAPTFAAYSASIVRSLEDRDSDCSTRHEGPLTTTSMQELLDDEGTKWLSMKPDDVRVEVLRELEKIGYVGLPDLLFSHLKSLLDKR